MSSRERTIGVLVMDESAACRHAIDRAFASAPDIALLGAAPTARTGLARLEREKPVVLVVSVGLPDMPFEEVVRRAGELCPGVAVIATVSEAESVPPAALEVAREVVVKPRALCSTVDEEALARRLVPKVRSASTAAFSRRARGLSDAAPRRRSPKSSTPPPRRPPPEPKAGVELVVVGASTGGPEALARLIPRLPEGFPAPVVVVVHMPGLFTGALAESLDGKSAVRVGEARSGEALEPGRVYVAKGGLHLVVERNRGGGLWLRMTDDPPENGCRPSVDVLFRSAAEACAAAVVAVILTGMGSDGKEGLVAIKAAGGQVIAQDEASSVVWGMPGSAVRAGVVDDVLALDAISDRLREKVGG